MPYYLNPVLEGITVAESLFNGTDITIKWYTAYPSTITNKIIYNIYYNDDVGPDFPNDFFHQAPAFVSIDSATSLTITDLIPGTLYHFAVKAAEYNPLVFDPTTLPITSTGLRYIPKSLLASNILATDSIIPLIDSENFPSSGTIKLGAEIINYSSISGNNLILNTPSTQRGYSNTIAKPHNTDGYDDTVFWDPNTYLWFTEIEDNNTRVFECQSRFDINKWSYTDADGYHQRPVDLLNTDLSASDELNQNFPSYDFAGYHRTNPIDILSGRCVGSYIGGEMGCYDGYTGSTPIRGISIQDRNLQRQEILLNNVGEPVILVKKQWTGITCSCYLPSQEYPEARCSKCMGSGFIVGYQQYFNPRRSDGRIMVRFDPTQDTVDPIDAGLESNLKPTCWTLPIPSLHERDFIIRFDQDGNEEFRYEILNVTRNKFVLDNMGAQRFGLQRIRKTDPIYQVRLLEEVLIDTDGQPGVNIIRTLNTSINSSLGIVPHSHTIKASQLITSLGAINGITSITYGHSHIVENGVVKTGGEIYEEEGIGHTHTILFTL